jgi:hypothetical protein
MRRRPRRGLALSSAAVALALYLFGVALSGRGGPIAQRPIFDGPGPVLPYHWSCPPEALAATNQKPAPAETTVRLGPKGSAAKTMQSTDGQIYFVMPHPRLFPPHPGATSVDVKATPECASKVSGLPNGLGATGNVYHLTATYEPGGDPVKQLAFPAVAILVYPVQPTLHTTNHTLFLSMDGKTWHTLDSTDIPSLTQVQGAVPSIGDVVVGQKQEPLATATPGSSSSGGFPQAWLFVVGAVVLVVLVLVALWRARQSA